MNVVPDGHDEFRERRLQLLQSLQPSGHDRHAAPRRGELERDLPPNARRSAHNESVLKSSHQFTNPIVNPEKANTTDATNSTTLAMR